MSAVAVASAPYSPFTTDEDRPFLDRVVACGEEFERGVGKDFRRNCEKWYRQYRGFSKWRNAWIAGTERDRDALIYDAKNDWGAQLHIPLSFRTIETTVPAAIAQRPHMLYLPRREKWAENVATVKELIDAQQEQIDIDLPYQAVMRSGRIYGLGVGKVLWRKEYAPRRRVQPHPFAGLARRVNGVVSFAPEYRVGKLAQELVFDDPDFEDVDIFDFMWDPYGSDIKSCEWVVHRLWMSTAKVLDRLRSGTWDTNSALSLLADGREEDHVRAMGNGQKYNDVWQARMEASGFTSAQYGAAGTRGEQIHEVWEFHDGESVLTVLDRQVLVVNGENPCVGEKPFMAYRPTPLQKQFVGIGDMEPLEHLQRELDTLRSQRRDAATMALAIGWAYDPSAVDEEDLVFRPNAAIPVTNSNPSEALMPLPRPDVPGSGYKEEEVIRNDFDAVIGITDALNPNSPSGTATEAFLVQASLSRRIELASRRFEIEIVRPSARCFLYLDQRMILTNRDLLLPGDGMTVEQAAQAGEWRKFTVAPGALMGDYQIVPEGGSMAARNVPQDRQDANLWLGLAQNPYVDPRSAMLKALKLAGAESPEDFLRQADPPVPAGVLDRLQRMGVDPGAIQYAIQQEQGADPQLQGPSVPQLNQALGAAA